MDQSTCVTPGCDRPRSHGYYCQSCRHYNRNPERREVLLTCQRCSEAFDWTRRRGPKPRYCSVDCLRGRLPQTCDACGETFRPVKVGQRYCRTACKHLAHKHPEGRPRARECSICGDEFALTERMVDGRLKWPAYTKRCGPCQLSGRPRRPCMTAAQVAERDGSGCRWCGDPVFFDLPDDRVSMWGPSVDHIVPLAAGGTDTPENVQLMHRRCNSTKGARPFALTSPQPAVGVQP